MRVAVLNQLIAIVYSLRKLLTFDRFKSIDAFNYCKVNIVSLKIHSITHTYVTTKQNQCLFQQMKSKFCQMFGMNQNGSAWISLSDQEMVK